MEWGFMSFEALVPDLVIWRGLSGKTRNKQHGISRMWIWEAKPVVPCWSFF